MDRSHLSSAAALLLACAALALTLNAVADDEAPAAGQATPATAQTDAEGPGGFVGYTGRVWAADFGITRGRCDRAAVARALSDPANATPGGAAVAALAGLELDDADRACAALALELARNGRTVTWSSGGARHALTASRDAVRGGQPCRAFVLRTTGPKPATVRGVACQPDEGVWAVAAP
jgi:surface antigen